MQYCSMKCAEEDWKWHKDFCRKKQDKKKKKRRRKAEEEQEEAVGKATEEKEENGAGHFHEEAVLEEIECSAMVTALKLN